MDIIIHLRPIQSASVSGDKAFVSIDLHVKCSKTYPARSCPEIMLENVKGISMDDLRLLKGVLVKKAEDTKGAEVIMELCQIVQEFLYERNKPPAGSFHDGMLRQKAAVEHEQRRLRATSEQRERDEVAAFEEMRKEKLLWKEAEDQEKSPARDLFGSELVQCVDGAERRICRIDKGDSRRQRPHAVCSEWTAIESGFVGFVLYKASFKHIDTVLRSKILFLFQLVERAWIGMRPFVQQKKEMMEASSFSSQHIHNLHEADNWGQNRELFVSEWNLEYSLGRKAARKNEFNTELFVSKLEWLEGEMLKLSKLARVDQSLYPYTLFALQKKVLTPTNVNVRIY
ncbi:unnamed protein product [Toxocara canis]|uniref:RWD domain-containing protein n=1 Tax=Toxocara canis TaxID=6265 RepID=A0A3P7H8X0_TOXCA|nr:unnamed protein product [Toxocara canis]